MAALTKFLVVIVCGALMVLGSGCDQSRVHGSSQREEKQAQETVLSGDQARAFLSAYARFEQDPYMTDSMKQVSNYTIRFTQDGDHLIVCFVPKESSLGPGEVQPGGATDYGHFIRYYVDRDDFNVSKVVRSQ
jgi:hypothetical protein